MGNCLLRFQAKELERGGGGGGRIRENPNSNSNSKTLFSKDCSLGSFRPVREREREGPLNRETDKHTDSQR